MSWHERVRQQAMALVGATTGDIAGPSLVAQPPDSTMICPRNP
jgi:hypothetical protein